MCGHVVICQIALIFMSFGKRVRNLDIFKKVPTDLSQSTNLGGIISLITTALICYLLFRELSNYLSPQYSAEINTDMLVTRQQMRYLFFYQSINLDIEFPAFPCELISLDLEDIMISHHPNIGSVEKWRLDKQGKYMDSRPYELLHEQNPIKQLQMVRTAFKNGHGCRLIGSFTVKEVPGNFHISCHAYYNHYMQTKMQGLAPNLNMSHTIHKLYFGKQHHISKLKQKHPEAQIHNLQNKTVVQTQNKSLHYHIDIVPTWYHESAITNYYTYQYTYKENAFQSINQPGVLHFNYQIGGLIMEVKPRDQDLWMFLIHLCAIVGGTFALCHAVYNLLSNFTSKFQYQLIQ